MDPRVTVLTLLTAQTGGPQLPPTYLPTWTWVTIVVAMGSAIAALAAAYKHARDEEMKAERGKTELLQKVQKPITEMMERAIEAFTLARTSNDQATQKYEQMISEQKDLERSSREIREELRRVAEKVDEIKHQR